jgi:hypothetical protein
MFSINSYKKIIDNPNKNKKIMTKFLSNYKIK